MSQTTASGVVPLGGIHIRYLIDGSAQGRLGMFEVVIDPRAHVPPPHRHANNDEVMYVLEGAVRFTVDGETRDLKAGDWCSSPRGSVHAFTNPFDAPARALVMVNPDIGNQYFVDVAEAVGGDGPPDPARLTEIMQRYGLEVVLR